MNNAVISIETHTNELLKYTLQLQKASTNKINNCIEIDDNSMDE